ncbi:unnamed protein product [Paramecium octaurelia]|uniref:non-specific serine/threonine protein kinase n=1 Tax=Paramecium octaurelia TaxID=43137 RepID=A0A8S1Y1Y1_PAROT|nr:unnamed protein product [Paramecium octaurelia]
MEIEKKFSQCGDYNILQTLGSGLHAKVKLGEHDGKKVAIKIFKSNHGTAANIKTLTNEINILKQLNHPNLVNLIEFNSALQYRRKNGQKEQRVCIILELAEGGELFEYVASSGRFSPETSRFYFKQLLSAMSYMASKDICHRDLKLENVLLDENFNLKVADFGFAKVMETAKIRTILGTPGYMAPEILAKKDYNGTKADIFSAGVIFFIIHAGSPPFSTASEKDQYFKLILLNKWEQFWTFHLKYKGGNPEFFPQEFRNLMMGMLAPNPDQRFTLEQCMQHPWVNGPVATLEQIQNEFRKRHERVQAEIQASKMKKQAQKNAANKGPIGVFRSIIGESEEENFDEIINNYKLNFENRFMIKGKDQGLPTDIIVYQDPKFVFCYLLKNCEEFNCKVDKIHETKYKINFAAEQDENLAFSLELLDCEDEKIKLNLTKLSGGYIQFKEITNRLRTALNKNYDGFLQQEVQQD